MKNWLLARIFFWGATLCALALFALSAPDGLPWGAESAANPVWRHFVRVFAGNRVAPACVSVALASGLVGALVFRFFGWRIAIGAALVWVFAPWTWYRALAGDSRAFFAAAVVFGAWLVVTAALAVTRRARDVEPDEPYDLPLADFFSDESPHRFRRLVAWTLMGFGILFALVSLTLHDYRRGEAASAYARGILEEAGRKILVLNGMVDEQILREKRSGQQQLSFVLLTDETSAYRARLDEEVRCAFPSETNLWVAARVGPKAFAEAAARKFPDRFYVMNGSSASPESWTRRWRAFKPYLKSSDPFVPVGRRLFAREGNAVANAWLDATNAPETAWRLYQEICEGVDPGNVSALVNLNEMIRRGYGVSEYERKKVVEGLDLFFRDPCKRAHAREIVREAGPIRADPTILAKLEAAAKRRLAERIAKGERVEARADLLTLVEWNNEMVRVLEGGNVAAAGRLARKILSNAAWRDFIPANAVMGSVAALERDYVSSEAFFRKATGSTNAVPPTVLNDFADTLLHLGKMQEAENMARRAVTGSDEKLWVARLTLAETLSAQGKNTPEIEALCRAVLRHAPAARRAEIRANVMKLQRGVKR